MEQKTDLRIIKTNINIRNTFIQLLNKKDFDSITVQNILDTALINRSTFYKHYSDKYDLAEAIAMDFLDKFKSLADVRFSNKEDISGLIKGMDKVYEKFYEERMTILGLWRIRTEKINVYEDMQTILMQKYIEFTKNHVKENYNIEYQACIFASLVLTTLKFVMESQKIYTAHELLEELQSFTKVITTASIKAVNK